MHLHASTHTHARTETCKHTHTPHIPRTHTQTHTHHTHAHTHTHTHTHTLLSLSPAGEFAQAAGQRGSAQGVGGAAVPRHRRRGPAHLPLLPHPAPPAGDRRRHQVQRDHAPHGRRARGRGESRRDAISRCRKHARSCGVFCKSVFPCVLVSGASSKCGSTMMILLNDLYGEQRRGTFVQLWNHVVVDLPCIKNFH